MEKRKYIKKERINTVKIVSKYRKLLYFERGSKSEALLLEMSVDILTEALMFFKK